MPFNLIDICIDDTTMWIKTLASTWVTSRCYIFHSTLLARGEKKDSFTWKCPWFSSKMNNCIKFWPLSTCLFNILCDTMGSMHEALSTACTSMMVFSRKSTCTIVWVVSWIKHIFYGAPFFTWVNYWQKKTMLA